MVASSEEEKMSPQLRPLRKREDMPAPASVAAVRSAELLVLFVAERHAAVPSVAGGDVDVGFVDELHGGVSIKNKAPTNRGFDRASKWPIRPG